MVILITLKCNSRQPMEIHVILILNIMPNDQPQVLWTFRKQNNFFRIFLFQEARIIYRCIIILVSLFPTSKFYFFGRISAISNFPGEKWQEERETTSPISASLVWE